MLRSIFMRIFRMISKRSLRLLAAVGVLLCCLLLVSCENSPDKLLSHTDIITDDRGLMVEQIAYDQFGKLASRSTYEYDESGNMIGEKSFDAEGNPVQSLQYEYDERGNQVRIIGFNAAGNMTDIREQIFDGNGNVTSSAVYDSSGKLIETLLSEFTADGYSLSSAIYDGDGNYLGGTEYEYYENGEIRKISSFERGRVLTHTEEYYPERGKYKSFIDYMDGKPYKGMQYDENGNATEIDNSAQFVPSDATPDTPFIPDPPETPKERIDEEYDDQGRLIRRDVTDSSGHREATVYIYDKKGDYIQYLIYDDKNQVIDAKDYNANGKLCSHSQYQYDAWGNETEALHLDEAGNPLSRTARVFRENGNMLEEREYRGMDELLIRTAYEYHPNGDLKKYVRYNADGLLLEEAEYSEDGGFISHTRYRYREDGRKESVEILNADGVVIQSLYYDEAGHPIGALEQTFYPNGNVHTVREAMGAGRTLLSTFDESGKVTEECWFNEKGEQTSRSTYSYNEAGQELDYLSYDARNNLTGGKRNRYFSDGSVRSNQVFTVRDGKEIILFQSDLSADRREFASVSYSEDGTILAQTLRMLDENNRILYEKEYSESKGSATEYLYEYYPSGNSRTATTLMNGKLALVLKYEDGCEYPVERLEYGNDGKEILETRRVSVYDAAGRLLSYKEYKGQDELRVHTEYVYNAAGKLVTQKEYNEKEELRVRTEYTYNAAGALAEQQEYDGAGRLIRLYTYDENELPIRIRHYGETGVLLDETVTEYHPNGNVKVRSYYVAGVLREYCTFDEDGNPLEQKYYYEDNAG